MFASITKLFKRAPDFTIHRGAGVYLRRWYIIPRNRWFNMYLHHFVQSDDPRALHDHPWWSCSIILRGGYYEVVPKLEPTRIDARTHTDLLYGPRLSEKYRRAFAHHYQDTKKIWRPARSIRWRGALAAHRIELATDGPDWKGHPVERQAWTLFITGPVERKWGFWCKRGWVPYDEYVAKVEGGNDIGAGCGEE